MRRRLAAILSVDVVDFSRRMSEDETGTLTAVLSLLDRDLRPIISEHGGTVFKTLGDGLLIIFDSAVSAVACAHALGRHLSDSKSPLRLRSGVHLGDVIAAGDDYFGDGVNIAKRLEAFGQPGEIILSGDVYRAVRRKLPLTFQPRGEQQLKNIPDGIEVYAVGPAPGEAPAPAATPSAPRIRSLPPVQDRASIIVLPFINLSRDQEQEYFCDGLTQDITTDLSKFANLFVFAANSAFTYKGRAVRPSALAEELGVRYLLEGSVQRGGSKIRLNAQLIEAESENHLWAERLDSPVEDLLDVQDQLVRRIVSALAVKVTGSEMERVSRKQTADISAYDAFLHGAHALQSHIGHSGESDAALLAAAGCFRQATEIDPLYARAWGWLAYVDVTRVIGGWADPAAMAAAESMAKRAVLLSPDDHDTHWALAFVYSMSGRPELGLAEYQQALKLNSNDANMLAEMAETLTALGHHTDAVAQVERAMQLNPHFPEWYRWALGWSLHHARSYERSNQQLELILAPSNEVRLIMAANHSCLAEEQAARGDSDRAAQLADRARLLMTQFRQRRPSWSLALEKQSVTFRQADDEERWLSALRRAGLA